MVEAEAHACGDTVPPLYLLWGAGGGHWPHALAVYAGRGGGTTLGQACGGVHGGTSPNGQGGGVHGVEGARLQMDGIPDGGCRPRGPEAAFAAVRAAASRGPAKTKLFVEDMVQVAEDVYARTNHRLTQIMQLPMQDRRRAVYAFVRGDTPFCPPAGRVRRHPPRNPFDGLPIDVQVILQRAPLHALLVPRSYIAHEEAMSSFPHWMAAVAQAFSQWIGSWMTGDYAAFREWSRVVSSQSWAMVRGTMVRGHDSQSDPWPQVYADHPAVGNIMGWPREVLPVFPLCNLRVLALAVVLHVGTLWLYDWQL